MQCASSITVKICSSQTATLTGNATNCGTYQWITLPSINNKTVCDSGEIQLTNPLEFAAGSASPWNLSMSEGTLIAAAILGVWALGFSIKALKHAINGGSPE
jgi:hypothetical protein